MPVRVSHAALISALFVAVAGPGQAANAPQPAIGPAILSTDQLMTRGLTAFQRRDYAAASHDFRLLAQRDVPAAETLLGTMSANGQGVARNDAVAAAWFLRAARRGYGPAQLALASAFAEGRGVRQDLPRAAELARAAAGQGQPGAAQLAARLGPPRYAQTRVTGGRP
jgi:TPR repeat protein